MMIGVAKRQYLCLPVDFLPALKDGDSYCAMQEKSPA
jgi:hypothetical protein